MSRYLAVIFLFLTVLSVWAETLEFNFELALPLIYRSNGFDRIRQEQMQVITKPGAPELPSVPLTILLPPGEIALSLTVLPGEAVELDGDFNIYPIQKPYPLSFKGQTEFTEQDPLFYTEDQYPEEFQSGFQTNYYRGHSLLTTTLQPWRYYPAQGRLLYYPQLTLLVKTAGHQEASTALSRFYRSDAATKKNLSSLVVNPDLVYLYPDQERSRIETYDYLIITGSAYENEFSEFMEFKTGQGYRVALEFVTDIYTSYTGVDNADKIRNCIIDYYENFGSEYVLLGGDTEIIPHRGFYLAAGSTIDDDLPCDLYYSGLDRVGTGSGPDWNVDNDSYWGETSEADYYAEVWLGRISADTSQEFLNALNKQIMYQNNPVLADVEKAVMVGENLNTNPMTWGGTYKDEIIDGGSYNGYYTTGFPVNMTADTQYDRDGTWSWTTLRDRFNNGVNLINHLGHSNTNYNMKFYTSYITNTNLTSNGTNHGFYIIYSQGCYPAAFDNRNSSGTYGEDVITEEFTTIANGCVAFIGNTRYGWYNPGGTDSGSQYLDRQFFDALFGEGITQLAAMNEDSRFDGAAQCNGDPWFRWAFYEITLFGDPSLDVWTAQPAAINASYPVSIPLGTTQIAIDTDTPGARIGLLQAGILIGNGITDGSGEITITLDNPVSSVQPLDISIIAHNRDRLLDQILVVANQPFVIFNNYTINDPTGNNNSLADFGETISLDLNLANVGDQNAYAVNAEITSADAYITLLDDNHYYGTINAGGNQTAADAVSFQISNSIPDQHRLDFELTVTGNSRETWNSSFNITVNAPHLEIGELIIDDSSGNNNGRFDPGETVTLLIPTLNSGQAGAAGTAGSLSSDDPYLQILDGSHAFGLLASGAESQGVYSVQISNDTPVGTPVAFTCQVSSGAYLVTRNFVRSVGLILEDFELGNFSAFEWQFSGNANWYATGSDAYEGNYCARSGVITHNQNSALILSAEVLAAGDISFYRKVSSENNYDYLRFYIDDIMQGQWCGEVAWGQVSYPVTAGNHTFKWAYEKDYSVSNGSDCGWIDYLIFPPVSPPAYPAIGIDPGSISLILNQGESGSSSFQIANQGEADLDFNISVNYDQRTNAITAEESPRDSGGPDTYGYTWQDSDDPAGPVYNWIDISGLGTQVSFSHNDNATALLNLEFSFNFYGTDYSQFRISPNGWLGFGADWTDYHNYEIPRVDAPRPAIFGLWDDLYPAIGPNGGGNVYYYSTPESLIVWFDEVIHYPGLYSGTYDFQFVLYAGGDILLQYRTVTGTLNSCSIGIQNSAGTDGLEVAYNETYLHNNLAILFRKPLNWLELSNTSGSVSPGGSLSVQCLFDSEGLSIGDYSADLVLSCNDPQHPQMTIPVSLTVQDIILTIPENISTQRQGNLLNLNWDPVPGASGYRIYAATSPDGTFSLINTVYTNSWSTTITAQRRFYRITAFN